MPTIVSKIGTDLSLSGSNNFLSVLTTSLVVNGVTGQNLLTSFAGAPVFTGSGETVLAVGLMYLGLTPPVAGLTITLRIRNVTDGVNTDYVYNSADFHSGGLGWNFFSLGDGLVFTAGKSWSMQLASNVSNRIAFVRTGVASDWNRMFVTSQETTAANGDAVYIGGRINPISIGGGSAITSYVFDSSFSLETLNINVYSSLSWLSSGLTLTMAGNLVSYTGGSLTIGTALNPVSGLIEFVTTAFGQDAFSAWGPGTFNIYGTDISSDYYIDLASTANAAQAAAVLTQAPDWIPGQSVAYTTTRNVGGNTVGVEVRDISTVVGTTVNSTANFTYAHDVRTLGTFTSIQDTATACLMNRGFVVSNTSASTGSWFGSIYGAVNCTWSNVYFKDQGANAATANITPSKYGWVVDITPGGSFNCNNCCFYNSSQINGHGIFAENNVTRKSTDYNITSCLFVQRSTSTSIGILLNGIDGANTVISDCIFACVGNSVGAMYWTRASHSGNVTINNCRSYSFYYAVNRLESTAGVLGSLTLNNCLHFGLGFYRTNPCYSTTFVINNAVINNCIAINRVGSSVEAAFVFGAQHAPKLAVTNTKFLGYNRYFYHLETVTQPMTVDNCHFEDDVQASQSPILLGASTRPNVSFKSCYFHTNATNQSFILLNWSNLPVYGGGYFNFKDCSFNGNGTLFIPLASQRFFYGYSANFENCLFRGDSSTINGSMIKMGKALMSSDSFTAGGRSVALTPTSNNEVGFPFVYSFLLATTEPSFIVNFKTKSYGLNGTVTAYIENDFGILTQSILSVSSGWDSQSMSASVANPYQAPLRLTIQLTGTTGYLVISDLDVESGGVLNVNGNILYVPEAAEVETSHLFC